MYYFMYDMPLATSTFGLGIDVILPLICSAVLLIVSAVTLIFVVALNRKQTDELRKWTDALSQEFNELGQRFQSTSSDNVMSLTKKLNELNIKVSDIPTLLEKAVKATQSSTHQTSAVYTAPQNNTPADVSALLTYVNVKLVASNSASEENLSDIRRLGFECTPVVYREETHLFEPVHGIQSGDCFIMESRSGIFLLPLFVRCGITRRDTAVTSAVYSWNSAEPAKITKLPSVRKAADNLRYELAEKGTVE